MSKRNKLNKYDTLRFAPVRRKKFKKRKIIIPFVSLALAGCIAFTVFCLWDLPSYENIDLYTKSGISTVYANDHKTELARITTQNRIETSINKVSPYVLNGAIATEDERFYKHGGFDFIGIVRAVFSNIFGGSKQGASTITQQLVRNTVLIDEMNNITIKRKVREIYISVRIERLFTKDQILMMYLNVINFGDNCYGIEAASENYFGVSADKLTLPQAAMLVGIPQSPTANNPREHYDAALERSHVVLKRMLSNGYITQDEYDKAIAKKPKIKRKKTWKEDVNSQLAPHFVDYVKQLVTEQKYNAAELTQGGLAIYTTLDPTCQKAAKKSVKSGVSGWGGKLQSSLTTVDPNSGAILAMIGGTDYSESEFNLSTQMSRQAGSSFKPFALIAAIQQGVDPDNTYIDSSSPVRIDTAEDIKKYRKNYKAKKNDSNSTQNDTYYDWETRYWTVRNSEGSGYGSMSLTSATTSSVNTVYARLTHVLGPKYTVEAAKACGIKSDLESVDSVCLGTQGVNTLEMASAYATIANGGIYYEPYAITQIVGLDGESLYSHEGSQGTRAIDEAVAVKVRKILQTVISSGTGTAAQLSSGQPCAGKTGTSEGGRDLWFCGFTPNYSTAIWAGYLSDTSTGSYGGTVCAPIWSKYMNKVLKGQAIQKFVNTKEKITYKDNWNFSNVGVTIVSKDNSKSDKSKKNNNANRKETEEELPDDSSDDLIDGGDSGGSSSGSSDSDTVIVG